MIIGCGIDIVELERIKDLIDRHGGRATKKIFTDAEIEYCQGKKKYWQHFAGRFAAKEAVAKALGTGIQDGIAFRDIEVTLGDLGAPKIVLTGGAEKRANELGVVKIHLSISHGEDYAVAQAIAEGS
ncbi:MAG: holo-ACP synthase [Planctomycetota bacterium]|nr:holo-ACP synthase [Planctomycetota bacterium]MDA1137847.1 holo-ACP synthase [Planctomycetota bacterium]